MSHEDDHHELEDEMDEETEQYIDSGDVLAEIDDDADAAMDEEEAEDQLGDLPSHDQEPEAGPSQDNSLQTFTTHGASVFAVAMHPTEGLAASGGEDDFGYIWDITDGEVIVKLTGHSDSVSATAWSPDGELISTGGMDGKVRIWKRVGKVDWRTWEFLTELTGPDEVMVQFLYTCYIFVHLNILSFQWLRWHPKGSVLLAGSNDTTVWLWQCELHPCIHVFLNLLFFDSTIRKYHASICWP
jgi:ribosome assembly protein SQT1